MDSILVFLTDNAFPIEGGSEKLGGRLSSNVSLVWLHSCDEGKLVATESTPI